MSQTFYSSTQRAFYRSDLHKNIPEDAVQITDEAHAQLLSGQSKGSIRGDETGHPVLQMPFISSADINAERDRRIAQGVSITTHTGQTIPVDTRSAQDQANIAAMAQQALRFRELKKTRETFLFRGADNQNYVLTPSEVIEIHDAVIAHYDSHYQAAWALKDRFKGLSEQEQAGFDLSQGWPTSLGGLA